MALSVPIRLVVDAKRATEQSKVVPLGTPHHRQSKRQDDVHLPRLRGRESRDDSTMPTASASVKSAC
jgi:hypothetical protein